MMSPEHLRPYSAAAWSVKEDRFQPETVARGETVFALANGYLGVRGSFEEGRPRHAPGTYINGFYDSGDIYYAEPAYGYATKRQTLINVCDGTGLRIQINGREFSLESPHLVSYRRSLDLRSGLLMRRVRWRPDADTEVEIVFRRLVSLSRFHLAAFQARVRVLAGEGILELRSLLDGGIRNLAAGEDPRIGTPLAGRMLRTLECRTAGAGAFVKQRTEHSGIVCVCAMENALHTARPDMPGNGARITRGSSPEQAWVRFRLPFAAQTDLRLEKFLACYTSLDSPEHALLDLARREARTAVELGFEALAGEQRRFLHRFWAAGDVEIEGPRRIQQGIRYNLFQLLQAAPPPEGPVRSIPAKGLTGEGYEGHTFWDTEIFVLPCLTYTLPRRARIPLAWRIQHLGAARSRAHQLGLRGALFPWRTIDGDEASSYFPAGTAQYHINAGIAYALRRYIRASGDSGLLLAGGAELVFETARMWLSLGDRLPPPDGSFRLNAVTGPDEYTALVNNNVYTNLMAADHLRYAAEVHRLLALRPPAGWRELCTRIGLRAEEAAAWEEAAAAIYIPFDQERGIHPQDDSFLDKAIWDFPSSRGKSPLLLHYHPLEIYRHQVLKQPDLVLALFLLGVSFSAAQKKRDFDYYDPLTVGDSSLSACIQSVMAAELGYRTLAYDYFRSNVRLDLEDSLGNTDCGIHLAAAAGSWLALVCGFAGFRDQGGSFSFKPCLPRPLRSLGFHLRLGESLLEVKIRPESASYTLLDGPGLSLQHEYSGFSLEGSQCAEFSLKPECRALIFDLDGVVTDTAEYHYQAWKTLAGELNIPFNRELNRRLKGMGRMESLELLLAAGGRAFSRRRQEELAERKNRIYRRLIRQLSPDNVTPGLRELLAACRAAGIRTGLASVSRNAPEVLRRLELTSAFDAIVDPAIVVRSKPDPEIFLTAAEKLRAPPRNCAGIEDAQAGIASIKAAGMFAVAVDAGLTGADLTVSSPADLDLKLLCGLFARAHEAPEAVPAPRRASL